MEGGDNKFAKFTVPTLKALLKVHSQNVSGNKQQLFFPTNSQSSGSLKNDVKTRFFFILHHLSSVIFANATVMAFLLLCNSTFNFHCYTQHEAMPTQKLAWKWRCDLSWLLCERLRRAFTCANQLHRIAQYACDLINCVLKFVQKKVLENPPGSTFFSHM